MGPVNATVRFVAELVALYGVVAGLWARSGPVLATAVTAACAVVWGVLRVPDDPGPAPVAVTGPLRLAIEAVVFGGGAVGLWAAHGERVAIAFGLVVIVHYVTTPDRLRHVLSFRHGSAPPAR